MTEVMDRETVRAPRVERAAFKPHERVRAARANTQCTLHFRGLPSARHLDGTWLRSRVAALAANTLPPVIWQRDANGALLSGGVPRVRFFGGVGQLAVQSGDLDLLLALAPYAVQAVSRECPDARWTLDRDWLGARAGDRVYQYAVARMVVRDWIHIRNTPQAMQRLSARIQAALSRNADAAGLDASVIEQAELRVLEIRRQIGMHLTAAGRDTGQAVGLLWLTFATDLSLHGHWWVGALTSKGYGSVRRIARAKAEERAA